MFLDDKMVLETIKEFKILPVIVIEDACLADPLADALIQGGLPCAEITLRTDAGLAAIEKIAIRADLLVGAGTVLSIDQAKAACDAGAQFIISPGLNSGLVRWCLEKKIPVYPGVSNPSDIMQAFEMGLKVLKFFPAGAFGGIKTLTALSSAFNMMQFIPTGGVNLENANEYLAHPQVIACGGSWMVKTEWINKKRFDRIIAETRKAVQALSSVTI